MSDCYRASDDDPYDDSSSSSSAAAASSSSAAPHFFSLAPNKWHSPAHHARSEILCYLSEIAEHDTIRGCFLPKTLHDAPHHLFPAQATSHPSSTTVTMSLPSSARPPKHTNMSLRHNVHLRTLLPTAARVNASSLQQQQLRCFLRHRQHRHPIVLQVLCGIKTC